MYSMVQNKEMVTARLGEVPIVDLKCATCDLASEVGQALKRFGFFYVSNHGVPQELLTSQLEQNRRLFDLPDQVKRSMAFNVTLDIGYTGGTGTSQALDPNAGIQAADTKEGFMLTNNAFMGAAALDPTNPRKFLPRHPHLDPKDPLAGATLHWPPGLPGYERIIRSYFASAYELNYRLNDLLFSSLGMDANERNRLGSAPFCVLKQLRYGPGKDALANGSSIGAGAHADWGSLTLLLTDETPGLQVEMAGEWLPVPPRRGMFIVNAGDQIEALTNGHYRSAKHRVITTSPRPRYSTAFFTYFNYKEPLTPLHEHVNPQKPLRRAPMDTMAWFQYKLRQSVGEKVSLGVNVSRPLSAASSTSSDASATSAASTTSIFTTSAASTASSESAANATCLFTPPREPQHAGAHHDAHPPREALVIRALGGGVEGGAEGGVLLGVEALGIDLLSVSDGVIDELIAAMHADGKGLLVVRNQSLSPEGYERALFRLGRAAGGFGTPLVYDRWPGQSPRLRCCLHVSLLGNYRARTDDELGTGAVVGDRIGEYKPAREELREWHTDGSFLARPKIGVALYAPSAVPVETCAPCTKPSAWWRTLLRWPKCRPLCRPAPASALPPEGGHTAFASGILGYERLEAAEREQLESLSAVHSWCDFMHFLEARDPGREKVSADDCAKKPDVTWPLVRTHPVTNRRSLYLNPKNGLRIVHSSDGKPASAEMSTSLVLNLTKRVLELGTYHHTWRPGDLMLWDNRVLIHAATPFDADKYERLIYRAEFPGEPVYFF